MASVSESHTSSYRKISRDFDTAKFYEYQRIYIQRGSLPKDNTKTPFHERCRAICKIAWRSLHYNLDESRIKCPSNLNHDGKTVREMDPRSHGFEISWDLKTFVYGDHLYYYTFTTGSNWSLIHCNFNGKNVIMAQFILSVSIHRTLLKSIS